MARTKRRTAARPRAASRRKRPAGAGRDGAGNADFERYCRETFDPAAIFGKPEVLKGYRVLSCTQYILGPSCASYQSL